MLISKKDRKDVYKYLFQGAHPMPPLEALSHVHS